ncbi:MAG: ATP-binding protein [Pseudomonadota bacterium]|nr:ATP-binding protein [Pseudomonadota bacterium]
MNNGYRSRVRAWLRRQQKFAALYTQLLISTFFILLIALFLWSTDHFWQNTQQPRLYKAAATQAQVLAESQSAVLVEILERTPAPLLPQAIRETVQKMLIVEDPAIGERFIRQLSLQIDYDTVAVPEGSLDVLEGESCDACFHSDILLTSGKGDILGVAGFNISGGYYQSLIAEMKPRLFAESSMVLILVLIIWIMVSIIFHRLHAAKRVVEASDQAKTRFMANVTHELRTPLNAIMGYTQLYKQDQHLMQHHRQGIETIDRSADHLLLMINDILEFSRANEESMVLHPAEIDLAKFLCTLVEMIRVKTQLKGLKFVHEFDEQLPACIVADEKRLRQILLNLLSNAVKFTATGTICFRVQKLSSRAGDLTRLRFSVEDSGIGINRKQLRDIFIPFHQLDNAITRAEGTGLGLAISQRFLTIMDSSLQVASKVGEGSSFWFNIDVPVVGEQAMAAVPDSAPTEAPLVLPDSAWLEQLRELAKRHNVLGIRTLLSELEQQPNHREFLRRIQPFIQQYRFKQLLEWLDQLD